MTVSVLAATIAPLIVMVFELVEPSVTSPLKDNVPAIVMSDAVVISPLTVIASVASSPSVTASVKSAVLEKVAAPLTLIR